MGQRWCLPTAQSFLIVHAWNSYGASNRGNSTSNAKRRRLLWHPRPRTGAQALNWSYATDPAQQKTLVFVPGLGCGNTQRTKITVRNLASLKRGAVDFDCLVGSFIEEDLLRKHDNMSVAAIESYGCYVEYKLGAGFADFMQAVSPKLLHTARYSHVVLMLEDVRLGTFQLDMALNISHRHGFSVISPRISSANLHPLLSIARSPQTREVIEVDVVELFVTIFRAETWECMFDLQDPTRLLHGHGPARLMYKTCKMRYPDHFKMGVLNFMVADHFGAKEKCKPIKVYDDLRHWSGPQQRRHALRRFQEDEYVDRGKIVAREIASR